MTSYDPYHEDPYGRSSIRESALETEYRALRMHMALNDAMFKVKYERPPSRWAWVRALFSGRVVLVDD